MAKTFGYGLLAASKGFATGLSMKMEKSKIDALTAEQKRLDKEKKDAQLLWTEWYTNPETKEFLNNLNTATQGERAYFISNLSRISKELFEYFTEIDDDIRDGELEEAKRKNDLVVQKMKTMMDAAKIGMKLTFADGITPMQIPDEELRFQKQIQTGKMAGGKTGEAMGRQMWKEREFGELPPETKEPDLTGAINYLKKFPNPTPEQFNSLRAGAERFYNVDLSNVTQESLRESEKIAEVKPEPTPAPTSTENIREDILDADKYGDAQRIYDNYAKKYDVNALGITDLKQDWGSGQISYLNKVKKSIENLLVDRGDKGKWLNNKPVTQEMVGIEFKGEQPASDIYEILYKSYIEYLEKLRKLGIDVTGFPKLKPLSEIEKVGGWEGAIGWGVKGVGFGIKKGDYKSIYR